MTKGYTSVKIPKVLSERIKLVLDQGGYRSVSEFVLDASRRRLEYLEARSLTTR